MKQLYFVRHGETEWNAIRRMQGQWNSNLNENGRGHADVNGKLLATLNIEALIASPLDRTQQTANIINQYLQLPIALEPRVMEWDCGDWSGHLYAEIETKWPEQWQAWQADRYGYRGPNCENYPDMITRSTPFLDELRRHDATNIAVVSHGMIGRVMVATLMDYDPVETMAIHQNNDVVYRVTLDDSGAATELAHFKAGIGPIPGVAG